MTRLVSTDTICLAAGPPIKAASLAAGCAPVISLAVLCRAPRTRTSHASGSRLLRDDPSIFSPPLASLGPRKTIGTRPCPSDFQLQILWFLTNPSQARDLGSSARQRLTNLFCRLDETATNQAVWLEANTSQWFPVSSKLSWEQPLRVELHLISHHVITRPR